MTGGGGHSRWPTRRRLGRLGLLSWLPGMHDSSRQWLGRTFVIRDKHSSGARECGLADLLRAAVPDGLSLPHLRLNIFVWFYTYIFEKSCNTRIPVHESCGPAVPDRCRTGVGPTLQASGRFRPGCDVLRHAHWNMEANDGTLWTALVGISGVTSCWWWCLR